MILFTPSEIRLIKGLLSVKSDADIARIINKPKEEVRLKIHELTGVPIVKEPDNFASQVSRQAEENNRQMEEFRQERERKLEIKKQQQEQLCIQQEQIREQRAEISKQNRELERQERERTRLEQRQLKDRQRKEVLPKSPVFKAALQPVTENEGSKKSTRKTALSIKQGIRQNRKKEVVFPTKSVDYSRKILVKVDTKTFVYINRGDDPAAAREQYLERHGKSMQKPHTFKLLAYSHAP